MKKSGVRRGVLVYKGPDPAGKMEIPAKTWLRGPGPPAALEGAWYQAASFRGGRGKLRARDGHRGESAASFTWLHDRHGVNIFVSASYVGTGCRRAGPPPKAGPAQAAVDSATEAPESGWFLAYSSSLGRRVIGEIIPESCIHLCEEPGAIWGKQIGNPGVHPHLTEKCPLETATYRPSTQ